MLAWGYNEEELVEGFLERAFALLEECVEDWEFVFVNDASTDRTSEIVEQVAAREPRLRVIHNQKNLKVGHSCRIAVAAARKEVLFWQTVDWSYDISHLRIFLELLKHYDVVQGARPVLDRPLSHVPLIRSLYRLPGRSDTLAKGIVSLINYYLIRLLFGCPFSDFQNVTFYSTKFVQGLDLTARSSFINPELLLKSHLRGVSFIEVPIRFFPRSAGTAKGTRLAAVVRSVADILGHWIKWGWKVRLNNFGHASKSIQRVSQPFSVDDEVLEIILPLFREYR